MNAKTTPSRLERYMGCMLGLACGDAVGTTVEFSPRGSFAPVTDMMGGGPFGLKAGQWTDDTSMVLCLAESLLTKQGFDARDQMMRYVNWWRWGYLSSTGHCFYIGMTVRAALRSFLDTQEPFSGSSDPETAGNGSLMRLAPAVLYVYPDRQKVLQYAADSSRTTHGASEAIESCQLFAVLLCRVLDGVAKARLFDDLDFEPWEPKIKELASGRFLQKDVCDIHGSGYCVESLEAALWCFFRTDTFRDAILRAANLGDDADTTAAIVGQIAGAYYGVGRIPTLWRERLAMAREIEDMAIQLCKN